MITENKELYAQEAMIQALKKRGEIAKIQFAGQDGFLECALIANDILIKLVSEASPEIFEEYDRKVNELI